MLYRIILLACLPLTTLIAQPVAPQKVQVAILLDVSGSMDGLIEQAKSQLWSMVTLLGKSSCATGTPSIEIALYEYGRSTNNASAGYVKQLSPFTTDLDQLSATLFQLTTNGGDEYCGQVIYTALNELQWDSRPNSYKAIFIAGNEDFLQGKLHYTQACNLAKAKGVIVNTIHCGNRAAGIRDHWNLNSECGNGSFSNINQNAEEEDIPTPYDSMLYVLNLELNATYMAYGSQGQIKMRRQQEVDQLNSAKSKQTGLQRVRVKAMAGAYRNDDWDLVDAYRSDSTVLDRIAAEALPAALQQKSTADRKQAIDSAHKKRSLIQQEIGRLATQRNNYITTARQQQKSQPSTLENSMEEILREQTKRFQIVIE